MDVTISCLCPPKADGTARHDQDKVTLPDTLDFRQMLTVRQAIRFANVDADAATALAQMTAVMAEAYLLHCISAWTIVDEKAKPVPVTQVNVRTHLLSNYEAAEKVADIADELYSEKVVLPLLVGASNSSSPSRTERPTSPPTNGTTAPKRSKRSSTSTIPMAVTGPMAASHGGGSSSSLT